MKVDKTQIPGVQFMFAVTCFLQSSALLLQFLSEITMQDSWIALALAILINIPFVFLYRALALRFSDKNLIQMLEEIFGKIAGKIIGLCYFWFFLTLTTLNLSDMMDFTKLTIMQESPKLVLAIMCMLVAALGVRHGIRLVARYSALFTVVAFFIIGASVLLVLNQVDMNNFLPMFTLPAMRYVQGTHITCAMPFGELVVFLMVTSNVRMTKKQSLKYWFIGFGLGAITIFLVLFRNIAVLGNMMDIFTLPSLVVLRTINLGSTLSRVEILYAVVYVMLLFFKIILLYYITVIAFAQIFEISSYRHLILSMGALIVVYALVIYPSPIIHVESAQKATPFLWSIFEFIIPLLMLVFAKVRKLPKMKEA